MVENVQMNMTNVEKLPCLIYIFFNTLCKESIQAKGNNNLQLTVVKPTSYDWGLGLWAVVLIQVTITGTRSCSSDLK